MYISHQPLEDHQKDLPAVCTEVKAEGCTSCPIRAMQESNKLCVRAVHRPVELVSRSHTWSLPGLTMQSLTVSILLNLSMSSVFQKVALTVYRCDSVMQIVFSVYLI